MVATASEPNTAAEPTSISTAGGIQKKETLGRQCWTGPTYARCARRYALANHIDTKIGGYVLSRLSLDERHMMQRLCTPSGLRACFQKSVFGFVILHLHQRGRDRRTVKLLHAKAKSGWMLFGMAILQMHTSQATGEQTVRTMIELSSR